MDPLEEARAVAARINKELGVGTVMLASEISYSEIPRIPTGSLALDAALGGGWPVNQWNEIIGDESSGKTALVLKTIATNQARDPEWACAWVAAEEFVKPYAVMAGCDLDRIYLINTNVMEVAYDAVLAWLRSKAVDCIVIDSLPALVPNEEAVKLMEDMQVSLGARFTGKFFRKAREAGKRSLAEVERGCTGIIINQWREKIGVMYGDNRTTPGGRGKNFHYFTRVELRRDDWIEQNKERIGQVVKARIIKNKSGAPQRLAVWDFYFDGPRAGQIDEAQDVFVTALRYGIITRRGAFYRYGEDSWQGRAAAIEALGEDDALREEVREAVLKLVHRTLVRLDDPQVGEG